MISNPEVKRTLATLRKAKFGLNFILTDLDMILNHWQSLEKIREKTNSCRGVSEYQNALAFPDDKEKWQKESSKGNPASMRSLLFIVAHFLGC